MRRGILSHSVVVDRQAMMCAALLALTFVVVTSEPSRATDYYQEDLRLPMAAAGSRGLEALLVRPAAPGRYPLAVITHGTSGTITEVEKRRNENPYEFYPQALAFARRGFAALVVMRRGYGESGGDYIEGSACCTIETFRRTAKSDVADLKAAINAAARRPDVSTQGMIAIGQSTGGFAVVALAADPPPGLAAAINFAGGIRSNTHPASETARDQAALADSFTAFGQSARTPMLWIYTANDKSFSPDLAHKLFDAFMTAGGHAQMIDAPAFGDDGHGLFLKGMPVWQPVVDAFLQKLNLGLKTPLPAPPSPDLAEPAHLSKQGHDAFSAYLAAGPHKAFAVSPTGAYGYWTGLRSLAEAEKRALAGCNTHDPACALYASENQRTGSGNASP